MMRLNFYGGINEIGGNKIFLEADGTALLLDFGKSYKEFSQYFEEYLNPRSVHGFKDYLKTNLIPEIDGLYRPDLIGLYQKEGGNLKLRSQPLVDGILLSHGHLDHAGYLCFLDPKIPVYLSANSWAVLQAFHISRPKKMENEIVELKNRLNPKKPGRKIKRKFIKVEDRKSFKIKNLEITPFFVDHSIAGASMFLIKTKEGRILYTGDFRLSEMKPEAKEKFIKELKGKVDLMICEGTRIKATEVLTEDDVYRNALAKVKGVKGLVVVDYSQADVVRFETLLKIAQQVNRRFALPYANFNYLAVLTQYGFKISGLENVILYAKEKSRLQKWEQKLIKENNFCQAEDIRKNQSKFMVALNFYQLPELIDWGVDENSYYLRAITEPHSEEMEISETRFINWITHFKMQGLVLNGHGKLTFDRAHISGHISGTELKEFLNEINPGLVIPIHTEEPLAFKEIYQPQKLLFVEKNKEIIL